MLESFTLATFAGRLGDTFGVSSGDEELFDAELLEATALGAARPGADREPFSLVFRGPVHVPQATYRVAHKDIGAFDLFLVPLGPDPGGMRYEAVFT